MPLRLISGFVVCAGKWRPTSTSIAIRTSIWQAIQSSMAIPPRIEQDSFISGPLMTLSGPLMSQLPTLILPQGSKEVSASHLPSAAGKQRGFASHPCFAGGKQRGSVERRAAWRSHCQTFGPATIPLIDANTKVVSTQQSTVSTGA